MEDYSTDERLQQETLCRRQWTDEYVERPETLMRQNVVVVWLECLLVDVVRHTVTIALIIQYSLYHHFSSICQLQGEVVVYNMLLMIAVVSDVATGAIAIAVLVILPVILM